MKKFTFWPDEMDALPREKKQEMIQALIKKSQKLKRSFILFSVVEMAVIIFFAYQLIFVYQVDLGRGTTERLYFVVAAVALGTLSIFPFKKIAQSEYDRLKAELP